MSKENKELEQEIHNEAMKLRTSPCYEEMEAFARHFVEWGKQQVMDSAIDGMILDYAKLPSGANFIMGTSFIKQDLGMRKGGKVKVIIVNEE